MLDAQAGMEVVDEACDGAEAVEQAIRLHPDVVIMDIHMPSLDGIEVTRRLLTQGTALRGCWYSRPCTR